ncbi:hypothetical protein Tco_0727270 [Tanacetum coccineum]|uniref:Uncharacterized protein n=1 Tax=Tanacetum coccineum TaxID=301880 RepID=A0ABQ4YHY0_9ASTR
MDVTRNDHTVEEPMKYKERGDPVGAWRGLKFHLEHQTGDAKKTWMKPSSHIVKASKIATDIATFEGKIYTNIE